MSSTNEIEFPLAIYNTRDLNVVVAAPLVAFWLALIVFSGNAIVAALFVPAYAGFQYLLRLQPHFMGYWEMNVVDVWEQMHEEQICTN